MHRVALVRLLHSSTLVVSTPGRRHVVSSWRGNQPLAGNRCATLEAQEAPSGGNYITLGELFVFGAHWCSCWDLYRTYTALRIFIHKKPHSLSNSEDAIFRANAKRSKYEKTGRWGLSY